MKVTTIIGANAYAVIKTPTRTMDVLIEPGKSVQFRLKEHATQLREKATRLMRDADFVDLAVLTIQNERDAHEAR
jgi:hypothetical protein